MDTGAFISHEQVQSLNRTFDAFLKMLRNCAFNRKIWTLST